MKRRHFIPVIATAPVASVLLAQRSGSPNNRQIPAEGQNIPVPQTSIPDAAALTVPRFLTIEQFGTLRKLAEVLMPPMNGNPGALEAGAPEFLDYLVGAWPERQQLYRTGLDELNTRARQEFNKVFAELDASQIDSLIRPMLVPLLDDRSSLSLGPFMNRVHQDVRTATMNSLEWAQAGAAAGRRGGAGLYWRPVDPTVHR